MKVVFQDCKLFVPPDIEVEFRGLPEAKEPVAEVDYDDGEWLVYDLTDLLSYSGEMEKERKSRTWKVETTVEDILKFREKVWEMERLIEKIKFYKNEDGEVALMMLDALFSDWDELKKILSGMNLL